MFNLSSSRFNCQWILAFFVTFFIGLLFFSTTALADTHQIKIQYNRNPLIVNQVNASKRVKLSHVNPALPSGSRNLTLKYSPLTPMQINHGSHWDSKTVTYQFDGMTGKYKAAFKYAIKNWNNIHIVKFVQNKSGKADIYLRQTTLKRLGDYSAGKNVIGLTYTSYYKSNDTLAQGARSYLITDKLKKYHISTGNMRRTAIHELGHALGMKHNSKQPSIMYPYVSSKLSIASGDVKSLYKSYHNLPND